MKPRWFNDIGLFPCEYRYFPDRESAIVMMTKCGLDETLHVTDWETSVKSIAVANQLRKIIENVFGGIDHVGVDPFPWFKVSYDAKRYKSGTRVEPENWIFVSDHAFVKVWTITSGDHVKSSISVVVDGSELFFEFMARIQDQFPLVRPPPTKMTYVLVQGEEGFRLQGLTNETQSVFVEGNYSDEVVADFQYIRQELNSPECNGSIVIFDGPPGSGKTHLVRFLINSSEISKFILIPPEMISSLSSPQMVAFLIHQANKHKGKPLVFVLEDADQALVPRDAGNVGVIQSLLNLTDGILGKALKLRMLCTTNAKSTLVDPAIMRPGRLLRRTNVGYLPKAKAEQVLKRLGCDKPLPESKVKSKAVGFGTTVEEPMYLLADLYALAHSAREVKDA